MHDDEGFRAFQRRIAAIPLLTAEEERALARRIERGDEEARRRLVEANLRLVAHFVRRAHRRGGRLSPMDLVQEGSLGLMRAAERFDHRRGVRFATYASWWIKEGLHRASELGPTPVDAATAEEIPDDGAADLDAAVLSGERRAAVADLLDHLTPVERRVIEERYEKLASPRDTAKALGTTPAKVKRVEDLALRRLRALPEVERLREAA